MNEHLTAADQSIILLTQAMGEMEPGLQTLTIEELNALELHVAGKGHDLAYIITPAGQDAFMDLPNAEQINRLLSRSFIVGMKVKEWSDNNVTVLCRTNQRYPQRVLERMGPDAPPALYCIGPATAINNVHISVNLPWEAGPDFHKYASQLGQGLQKLGCVCATGGDAQHEKALLSSASSQHSTAIGVVRTELLQASQQRAYRQAINKSQLLLISHHSPEHAAPPEQEDHNTVKALIHTLAGRTMVVHELPSPGWNWSDLIPEPPTEPQQPDVILAGESLAFYDRHRT